MRWNREDMQNEDNVLDALEDWQSGLFDEQDAEIQRKLDAERRRVLWRRLGLGVLVGGLLLAAALLFSGCAEVVEPLHRELFQQDCTSVPGYCVPLAKRVP
jgi:hypothetical protein